MMKSKSQGYVNYYKFFLNFSAQYFRKSGKNIIFDNKKINKSNFYRNKKLFKIGNIDITKLLVSKRESSGKKTHLNILLDIMTMMKLDHYV